MKSSVCYFGEVRCNEARRRLQRQDSCQKRGSASGRKIMANKQQRRLGRGVAPLPASNPLIVRAKVNRREEKSSDYFSVYANDVQLQTPPWDMRLTLGVISSLPTEDVGPVTATELGDLPSPVQLAN